MILWGIKFPRLGAKLKPEFYRRPCVQRIIRRILRLYYWLEEYRIPVEGGE